MGKKPNITVLNAWTPMCADDMMVPEFQPWWTPAPQSPTMPSDGCLINHTLQKITKFPELPTFFGDADYIIPM